MSTTKAPAIGEDEFHDVDRITPLILCGGFGRRLWPLSRPYWPKPFLDFGHTHSLLQQTALRFQGDAFASPVIICNEEHRFGVAQQLQDIGLTDATIILEQKSNGTALAVMAAAQYLSNKGVKLVAATPADFVIDPIGDFQAAIVAAAKATSEYDVVLLGVPPYRATSDYGYIQLAPETEVSNYNVSPISHFVEKPSLPDAEQLLTTGRAFWNGGLFVFQTLKLLGKATTISPELTQISMGVVETASHQDDFVRLGPSAENQPNFRSFDIEIIEKCDNVGMTPIVAAWREMGTWQAIWDASKKDEGGNVSFGDTITSDAKNNLIMGDGIRVVAGNVHDLAIIASGDSLIVSPLADSSLPEKLLALAMKKGTSGPSLTPSKVHREWGEFEIIRTDGIFSIKRITIEPGKRLSLQRHQQRSEHWIVVEGQATVTLEETIKTLDPNDSIFIPVGCLHRLANDTPNPLVIIEVQTGNYLGEDDIERVEDDFNRN